MAEWNQQQWNQGEFNSPDIIAAPTVGGHSTVIVQVRVIRHTSAVTGGLSAAVVGAVRRRWMSASTVP